MEEYYDIMKVIYKIDSNIWFLGSDIKNRMIYEEANKEINFYIYQGYLKLKSNYNELLSKIDRLEDRIEKSKLQHTADIAEYTLEEIYTKIQNLQETRRKIWNDCISNKNKITHVISEHLSNHDLKLLIHLLKLPFPTSGNNYFDEDKELKQTLLNWFDVGIVDDSEKWENFLINETKEIIKIK